MEITFYWRKIKRKIFESDNSSPRINFIVPTAKRKPCFDFK